MALVEELIERAGGPAAASIGAGVAALVLAPRVSRPLGHVFRSLVKGTIKGYLVMAQRTRTSISEAALGWQRLYDEARAEVSVGDSRSGDVTAG